MDTDRVLFAGVALAVYLGTSYWVFTDVLRLPRMLQLHGAEVHRDLSGAGAPAWLLGCLVLWPLAFPTYVIQRGALIRTHRARYDAFHREVTETGLPACMRRQALINGLYLASAAFLPEMVLSRGGGTRVVFLWNTDDWSGWALLLCGALVLFSLAMERSVTGPVRRRVARGLMPGLPLLVFACVVAVLGIAHLERILGLAAESLRGAGLEAALAAYAWALLFWMFPAVAAVNMATEAFTPGLAALFAAVRAIWKDDSSPRAQTH